MRFDLFAVVGNFSRFPEMPLRFFAASHPAVRRVVVQARPTARHVLYQAVSFLLCGEPAFSGYRCSFERNLPEPKDGWQIVRFCG